MSRISSSIFALFACVAMPAMGFDAGGFALQQHQHQLLEQQTAPNNDRSERLQEIGTQTMRNLHAEYEERVKRDGREAAELWLIAEAYRLGQEAALAGAQ